MKKIFEFIKTNKLFVIIVFLLLVILFLLRSFINEPPEAIDSNIKILFPADISNINGEFLKSNHSVLINLLQERETSSDNLISSGQSIKMQSLMFYCAIISGLVYLIFIWNGKMRKKIIFITLIVIPLFYIVDIHQQDLLQRKMTTRSITSNSINQLANPYNDTIYVLNVNMSEQYNNATKLPERWIRKAYKSIFSPDLLQFVYFILPWFSLLIFRKTLKKTEETK